MKLELAMHDTLVGRGRISYEPYTLEEQFEEQKRAMAFLNNEIDDIEIHSIRQVKELFFQFKNIYHSVLANRPHVKSQRTFIESNTELKKEGLEGQIDFSGKTGEGKVGTLNQQFGFSLGKANPSSRPAEPLQNSFLRRSQKHERSEIKDKTAFDKDAHRNRELIKKKSAFDYENMEIDMDERDQDLSEGDHPTKDKKTLFEDFKNHSGKQTVLDIRRKVKELNIVRQELDLCISACNDLKGKIDRRLETVFKRAGEGEKENVQNSDEDYRAQVDVKQLKKEHSEFLGNYKQLKRQYKKEERELLKLKKDLLSEFEDLVKENLGRKRLSENYLKRHMDSQRKLVKMNSEELVFVKARQKFDTLKRLKKLDKMA